MNPDQTAWRGIYHVTINDKSIPDLRDNNMGRHRALERGNI
jgi:hypothetical protein